ncbi:MAG: succinate dehydrogenase, cytochrome b556 subunit [Pseudomonadota bacterium]
MATSNTVDTKPLSPHVQIWKWHWTMAASICHRVSGCALYFGTVLLAAWVISAASGPEAYTIVESFMLSWFGQFALFGFTAAMAYHFANGIRHLVWDGPGIAFAPGPASMVSILNFVFAILVTLVIWLFAYLG